jgi:ferredoxin-NADP reductase
MAERRTGTTVYRENLSPILSIFRLHPEDGTVFPPYKAGQYIALRRENCKLTKRIIGPTGQPHYIPDLDEQGRQRRGPVTHSYSIASAPYETVVGGYLEFYVILERLETGEPGRLTESLFEVDPEEDNKIIYFGKIAGEFTLDKRAAGRKNVVFVATGTGLAPFASMIKQLHYEAEQGDRREVRYTLVTSNRGASELGYDRRFREIQEAKRIDFVYVPFVSRPSSQETRNPAFGKGRANNFLRTLFDMPLKEEQTLQEAASLHGDVESAQAQLERAIRPVLPQHVTKDQLLERMNPSETVFLTCGNPRSMEDIQFAAESYGIAVEKEEW